MELENMPWVSCFNNSEIFPSSFARDTGERYRWFFPSLTRTYWPGKHPVKSVAWGKAKVYSATTSLNDLTDKSLNATNSCGFRQGFLACLFPFWMSRDFKMAGGLLLNGLSKSKSSYKYWWFFSTLSSFSASFSSCRASSRFALPVNFFNSKLRARLSGTLHLGHERKTINYVVDFESTSIRKQLSEKELCLVHGLWSWTLDQQRLVFRMLLLQISRPLSKPNLQIGRHFRFFQFNTFFRLLYEVNETVMQGKALPEVNCFRAKEAPFSNHLSQDLIASSHYPSCLAIA